MSEVSIIKCKQVLIWVWLQTLHSSLFCIFDLYIIDYFGLCYLCRYLICGNEGVPGLRPQRNTISNKWNGCGIIGRGCTIIWIYSWYYLQTLSETIFRLPSTVVGYADSPSDTIFSHLVSLESMTNVDPPFDFYASI